jgi:hypothetical protein
MNRAAVVLLGVCGALASAKEGDQPRRLIVIAADEREVVQLRCGDVLAVRLFSVPVLPKKKSPVVDVRATERSLHFVGRAPVVSGVEGSTSEEAFFAATGKGENVIDVRLLFGSIILRHARVAVMIDCSRVGALPSDRSTKR